MYNGRFAIILLLFFLFPFFVSAQSADPTDDIASPFAVTAADKERLLEKTEKTLLWFQTLNRETRLNTPPPKFREKISPLELMQAAAILKEKEQPDMSRIVREMLPYFRVTASECFEIEERLGSTVLDSFQEEKEVLTGDVPDSATRIRNGAAKFLKESLRPAEKIALMEEPKSSLEIMKAVDVLSLAGRPVLVRYYLSQFLALNPEPEECEKIVRKIGSAKLMQLAGNKSFAPQGEKAVAKIFSALGSNAKPLSDDEKKESLAAALQSGDTAQNIETVLKLADIVRTDDSFLLYEVLFAEPAVLSEAQKEQILQKLRRRHISLPKTAEDAAAVLSTRANDYAEKNRPLRTAPDGTVLCWIWNDKEKKTESVPMSVSAAYREYAYRYARQAFSLNPAMPLSVLYHITLLERAAHLNGLDEPLDLEKNGLGEEIEDIKPEFLEQILSESLKREQYGAAQVAATLLGQKGSVKSQLHSTDGQPRPLVLAAVAKNRRVRFAAVEAVMNLKPETPYPGSSFVAETLTWFSRADGRPILVSAHPKQSDAVRTAGYFISCGYKGEIAVNGKEAMRQAADNPDVEIVTIDLICSEPPVPVLLQEMRKDARTAEIPVAVLTNKQNVLETAPVFQQLPLMQKTDRQSPDNPFAVSLSLTYPRIVNDDGAKWVNGDLLEKTGANPVPPAKRVEQAKKTLAWILEIIQDTEKGQRVYHFENIDDTISRALRSDVRVLSGLPLAASVKSGVMQNAIYDIIADIVYPMELRDKAGNYFIQSIEKYGVLLRGQQVQRLYDRYNASKSEPKESQQLLGIILDAVEKKTLEKEEK